MPVRRSPDGSYRLLSAVTRPRARNATREVLGPSRLHTLVAHSDEDELSRLVDDVREARTRLTSLIAEIKAKRAGWQDREQAWERWRSHMRNPARKRSDPDVH
jgi:uncharacterized protein YhaN